MLLRLLLLFTLVPTLELYLLLVTASVLGLGSTLLVCVLTGVAGAHLARREGLSVLARVQAELREGRLPGGALLEGALVFAGGLLLLTPGIATDVLGFSLVLPPTRRALAAALGSRLRRAVEDGGAVRFTVMGPGGPFEGAPGEPGPGSGSASEEDDPYDDPRIRRIVHRRP